MKIKSLRNIGTRQRIMQEAFELFGRHGFEGTSVRMIAQKSGVNLAAINYHFKSKEGLFWEIMLQTYEELSEEIGHFAVNSNSTAELALKVYDYFLKEKYVLLNTMKVLLKNGIAPPTDVENMQILNDPMGPPGGVHFAVMIQNEIPYRLSREGLLWGVKSIFGSVFHWSTMICAEQMDTDKNLDSFMNTDQLRKDVQCNVEASMQYLKSQKLRFAEI